MRSKKILVTGGCGFIGSALVRRLAYEGHKVRVLDNVMRGARDRLKGARGDIEILRSDIRNAGAVRKACKGVHSLCHLAYLNGTEFFYSRPDLVLDIGIKGMVNVVDSCVQEGVKELLLLSSSEVYQTPPSIPTDECVGLSIPDPLNPRYSYAGGKIASELMAINYGRKYFRKVVIVRPHNVYGPDMGWEHVIPQFVVRMKKLCRNRSVLKIKFPIHGSGRETRAFIFIDDFIDGLMLAMKKGRHLGIYNIGTMDEMPVKNVALEAARYFGRKIVLVPGQAPGGSPVRRCPDIKKIMALGFRPKTSFRDGFEATARWYDENSGKPVTEAIKNRVDNEDISCS